MTRMYLLYGWVLVNLAFYHRRDCLHLVSNVVHSVGSVQTYLHSRGPHFFNADAGPCLQLAVLGKQLRNCRMNNDTLADFMENVMGHCMSKDSSHIGFIESTCFRNLHESCFGSDRKDFGHFVMINGAKANQLIGLRRVMVS
jgi:hypothetical protein